MLKCNATVANTLDFITSRALVRGRLTEWLLGNSNNFFSPFHGEQVYLFDFYFLLLVRSECRPKARFEFVSINSSSSTDTIDFIMLFFRITSSAKRNNVRRFIYPVLSQNIQALWMKNCEIVPWDAIQFWTLCANFLFHFVKCENPKHVNEVDDAKCINKCEIMLNCAQLRWLQIPTNFLRRPFFLGQSFMSFRKLNYATRRNEFLLNR